MNDINGIKEGTSSSASHWVKLPLLAVASIFVIAIIAGMTSAHMNHGGGMPKGKFLGIYAVFVGLLLVIFWQIKRTLSHLAASQYSLARRDKLNRKVMIISILLGVAMVFILNVGTHMTGVGDGDMFSSSALSPPVAVIMVGLTLFVTPLLIWFWHEYVIDEQEALGVKDGALIALYFFWIVGAAWWFLWRGGLLPPVDGVALYVSTLIISAAIWFYKKYN